MSLSSLRDALDNWKLNIDRPFSNLSTKEIVQGAIQGLDLTRPDLEVATVALSELEHRTLNAALNGMLEIQDILTARGHQTIRWLLQARKSLNILTLDDKPNENYTASLYVILRDGYTKQNGRYGIYVGQTTNTPEHRFEEHMAGINAGNGLQKNGIQLMRSLMWPWQKVPGAKRLYYESALHKALEIGNIDGLKVTGDVVPIEEWPENFQTKLRKYIKSTIEVEK